MRRNPPAHELCIEAIIWTRSTIQYMRRVGPDVGYNELPGLTPVMIGAPMLGDFQLRNMYKLGEEILNCLHRAMLATHNGDRQAYAKFAHLLQSWCNSTGMFSPFIDEQGKLINEDRFPLRLWETVTEQSFENFDRDICVAIQSTVDAKRRHTDQLIDLATRSSVTRTQVDQFIEAVIA